MSFQHIRNEQVIPQIIESTLDLLKKKQLEEIHVVEIVKLAGVSRNSFYRNFNSKEDVLRRYVTFVTDEWLADLHAKTRSLDPKRRFLLPLLEKMYNNRDFVAILTSNRKLHLLEDELGRRISAYYEDIKSPWECAFLTGGVFKVCRYWAETGYRETPERILQQLSTISW